VKMGRMKIGKEKIVAFIYMKGVDFLD